MKDKISEADFIAAWQKLQSPTQVAQFLGLTERSVMGRRQNIERMRGISLQTVAAVGYEGRMSRHGWEAPGHAYQPRHTDTVKDGIVLVFGDAHYWPGNPPLAHEALCILAKKLRPELIVANGDIFDGATVSRHDPLGWQKLPTAAEEIAIVKQRLAEIDRAAPDARKRKTVGNHDSRFDRKLASMVSEMSDIEGFRLEDHLKGWPMSYSVMLNEELGEPVMIRHAYRGGIHAVYNNTLHAGVSIVTGHLHAQLIRPFTDYRGTRYGVDHGVLADTDHASFSYTMDGPTNWRSGFAVLTFDDAGRLLPPELCEVQRIGKARRAMFRGRAVIERAEPNPAEPFQRTTRTRK